MGIAIDDQVPADVSAVVVPTVHQTLWEQQLLLTPLSIVSAVAVVTIQQTARDRETLSVASLSQQPGNSGTAIKSEDTGKKATVAVPELLRIQELHRVILTGVDVFAQARFPNLQLMGEVVSPHLEAFALAMLICQQIQPGRRSLAGRPAPFRLYKFNSSNGVRFPFIIS